MTEKIEISELTAADKRGVNMAAALAREQLKYALALAQGHAKPGQEPDASLVAALLQAMARNYAAVK